MHFTIPPRSVGPMTHVPPPLRKSYGRERWGRRDTEEGRNEIASLPHAQDRDAVKIVVPIRSHVTRRRATLLLIHLHPRRRSSHRAPRDAFNNVSRSSTGVAFPFGPSCLDAIPGGMLTPIFFWITGVHLHYTHANCTAARFPTHMQLSSSRSRPPRLLVQQDGAVTPRRTHEHLQNREYESHSSVQRTTPFDRWPSSLLRRVTVKAMLLGARVRGLWDEGRRCQLRWEQWRSPRSNAARRGERNQAITSLYSHRSRSRVCRCLGQPVHDTLREVREGDKGASDRLSRHAGTPALVPSSTPSNYLARAVRSVAPIPLPRPAAGFRLTLRVPPISVSYSCGTHLVAF
ncbi:hypothetical protein B0H12DRAFT_1328540 [Mycena haematopus]|nr:hypothetical protein B0H12DRAFT_1328540 [Mycena haematopus]